MLSLTMVIAETGRPLRRMRGSSSMAMTLSPRLMPLQCRVGEPGRMFEDARS
jgi:hypothetical protein